jgi:hypothetical protein
VKVKRELSAKRDKDRKPPSAIPASPGRAMDQIE